MYEHGGLPEFSTLTLKVIYDFDPVSSTLEYLQFHRHKTTASHNVSTHGACKWID